MGRGGIVGPRVRVQRPEAQVLEIPCTHTCEGLPNPDGEGGVIHLVGLFLVEFVSVGLTVRVAVVEPEGLCE